MKVICLMAVTADGMIARDSSHTIDWTGSADKQYFVKVTRESGVMIMGSKTHDMIGRPLPGRKNIVMTRDKTRKSHDADLIFTDQPPQTIVDELKEKGFKSAALIGGAVVNSLFLEAQMIDEIHVTMVPKLFGRGISLFDQSVDIDLELLATQSLEEGHILLKYKVRKV